MLIQAKTLIGLKAATQSGKVLGRVVDFEVDSVHHNIINYLVQGDLLGLLKKPLIISANQVVEINKKEIIVKDAVIEEGATEKEAAPVGI